jgi:hypothetical protein
MIASSRVTTDFRRLLLVTMALAATVGLVLAGFAISRPSAVTHNPSVGSPVVLAPAAPAAPEHQSTTTNSQSVSAPNAAGRFGPVRPNLPMDPASVARRANSDKSDIVCPGKEPCGP